MKLKRNKINFRIGLLLLFSIVIILGLGEIGIITKGSNLGSFIIVVLGIISLFLMMPYVNELSDYNNKHKPPFAK